MEAVVSGNTKNVFIKVIRTFLEKNLIMRYTYENCRLRDKKA